MKTWHNFKVWLKCIIFDPFNVRGDVAALNASTAKFQGDIYHSMKRLEELLKAFHGFDERLQEHMFLTQVKNSLHYSTPDMFWVKGLDGKYIIANDAIRKNLLFCEDPIGKTDRELAELIHRKVGQKSHTFGAICGNSDIEVVKNEQAMKFNEDGLVVGNYTMLQVHKNVVRDTKGNIIAVVGVGRDITYEVEMLNKAIEETECEDTKEKLQEIINHYRFEDRT